ncbi:MAG: hypothetical protein BJ554DRAFT_2110 [Olpidium bornovanus]|uniref:Uncharacterized protein n=1 Tax=Olpidium bornovanus TaxID=278681 RepID=A0A8H8A132_9FUNG|nr:MAG: hypothetical protein BJ554DRAFT_2110 [Olpidium bornovanus]
MIAPPLQVIEVGRRPACLFAVSLPPPSQVIRVPVLGLLVRCIVIIALTSRRGVTTWPARSPYRQYCPARSFTVLLSSPAQDIGDYRPAFYPLCTDVASHRDAVS